MKAARIVLTGSSSGIGRALAERLVRNGHAVWGLARRDQAEFAESLRGATGSFQSTRCDVAEWTQVERAAELVTAAWPHLDAVITCAGLLGEVGPALTADPARWSATVRANLDGTFHALRAFQPLLARAPRRAKAVCFSGGGATQARPNFSAYGVAKTGIVRLVETIAEEPRSWPLDINAVAPGAINTGMTDTLLALGPTVTGDAAHEAAIKQKADGGDSMDKALQLIEWLLSPASDGISGRLLSAQWDSWPGLDSRARSSGNEIYKLRRILPEDRD